MTAPRCKTISARTRHWCGAVLVAVAVAGTPLVAAAQSRNVEPLISKLDRLERQLQALERTVYRGSPPPPGAAERAGSGSLAPAAVSQLQVKSNQLEEQMRSLTGQIEVLSNEIRTANRRLDKLIADVDFRLRTLEEANGLTSAAPGTTPLAPRAQSDTPVAPRPTPGPSGAVINQDGAPGPARVFGTLTESQLRDANIQPPASDAPPVGAAADTQQALASAGDAASLPPGSAEDRYDYARSFLMRRDFDGAERAFRTFVETYPESELAGNAQYWLGETYYVRDNFGLAAQTFADGFQRYPGSSKAPDNLLKLGMSLAALQRTEDACITLSKLDSEYPQAPANIKRRVDQERARLQCP